MILIGLGANLASPAGPPAATLQATLESFAAKGLALLAVSRFFVSPAWPDPGDPAFVNAVARIDTTLAPRSLLVQLHDIEAEFGRHRSARNAPRTLDLDIIDYDGRVEDGPPHLPHPRLADRAFVLIPLAEVAPEWVHPVSKRPVAELIAALGIAARDVHPMDRHRFGGCATL